MPQELYFDSLEEAQAYLSANAESQSAPPPSPPPAQELYFDSLEEAQAYLSANAEPASDPPPSVAAEPPALDGQPQEPPRDNLLSATGKALGNVPERMQLSTGGLLRMTGEDMSAKKARYLSDRARQAGVTPDQYESIVAAKKAGLVDRSDTIETALIKIGWEGFQPPRDTPYNNPDLIAQAGDAMAQRAQSEMTPIDTREGSAAYYVSSAIGSLAEMMPALAASIATRKPTPAMAVLSAQVGGQSYQAAREKGASPEEAQRYALGNVAAEVLPEGIPLGAVLKQGRSLIARVIGGAVAEGAQEVVTEVINIGLDQGILNEDITWGEARQRLKDALIIGNMVGGGMGVTVATVDAANQKYQDLTPGRQFAKQLQANVDHSELVTPNQHGQPSPIIQPSDGLRPMSELIDEALARRKPKPPAQINYGDNAMAPSFPAMASEPVPANTLNPTPLVDDDALDPDKEATTESRAHGLDIIYTPLDEIKHSPDLPQFKSGANEDGVVDPLGGYYDPRGESPIQLWIRLNGRKEIITGRHRFDLAKRTDGQDVIPAQYYYEADGFTAKDAATLDALLNIREGQGRVKDYIGFIQGAELTREEADAEGILARSTGQRAYTIATQGTDILISAHANDEITDQGAERIAVAAPNDEAYQAVGINAIQEGKSINMAVQMIKSVQYLQRRAQQDGAGGNGDLFGFDDSAIARGTRMAKRATAIQAEITRRIGVVRGAARNPKAAAEMGVNVKDPEGLNKKIEELKATRASWDNWEMYPELVQMLDDDTAPAQHALFTPVAAAPAAPAAPAEPAEPDLFSTPLPQSPEKVTAIAEDSTAIAEDSTAIAEESTAIAEESTAIADYPAFKRAYVAAFEKSEKYEWGQAGSRIHMQTMADLVDQYPEWASRVDEEIEVEGDEARKAKADEARKAKVNPLIDLEALRDKATNAQIKNASDEALRLAYDNIRDNMHKGLTNVLKDHVRRYHRHGKYDRGEAVEVVTAYRDYWVQRAIDFNDADAKEAARSEQMYGRMTPSELEAEAARLRGQIDGLQGNEFKGDKRTTSGATRNEGARSAAAQLQKLERYIKSKPKPKAKPEAAPRVWTLVPGRKSKYRSHDGATIVKMTMPMAGVKPLWLLYAPGESLEGGHYHRFETLKEAKNATPMAYDHVNGVEYPWTPETPSIHKPAPKAQKSRVNFDGLINRRSKKPKLIDLVFNDRRELDVSKTLAGLPEVRPGHTRLYRGYSDTVKYDDVFDAEKMRKDFKMYEAKGLKGVHYSDSIELADYYRETYGPGSKIVYVDYPTDALPALAVEDGYVIDLEQPTPKAKPKAPAKPHKQSAKAKLTEHQKAIQAGLVEAEKIGLAVGKGDINQNDATDLEYAIVVRDYIERMIQVYKQLKPLAETAKAASTLTQAMNRKRVAYSGRLGRMLKAMDDENYQLKTPEERAKERADIEAYTAEWVSKFEATLKKEGDPEPRKTTPARPGYPVFYGDQVERDQQIDEMEAKLKALGINVSRDDVDYQRAEQAYRNISFRSESRALSEQASYLSTVQSVYDDLLKYATTDEKKVTLVSEVNRYAKGYIKHNDAVLDAKSRTMSSMITGPARFPTASNQKKLDTEQRRMNELLEWSAKAKKAIKRALTPELQPISSTDSDAIEKLTKKLEAAEKYHRMAVSANKIVRSKKLDQEGKLKALIELGYSEKDAKMIMRPDEIHGPGFARYELSNSSAEIKRIKGRIAELQAQKGNAENVEGGFHSIPFEGGSIEIDYQAGYVRLHHDEKPSKEARDRIKAQAFRWAPSESAWRRKLTRNGVDAAAQAVGVKLDSLAIMRGEVEIDTGIDTSDGTLKHSAPSNTLAAAGANWVEPYRAKKDGLPERSDTYTINGIEYKTPRVQRMEPIKHLVTQIAGHRVYYRHIKGRGTAGLYSAQAGWIRVKDKHNIETLAHELAHYLDFYSLRDDVPNFQALYRTRKHKKTLKGLSDDAKAAIMAEWNDIDKTNLMSQEVRALSYTTETRSGAKRADGPAVPLVELEGFAEFVRLWLTNSNAAANRAPKFNDAFNRVLAQNPKLQRQLTKLRVMMHNYYKQGPIGRTEAGTGNEKSLMHKWDEWRYRRISRIRQAVIDEGHAWYKVDRDLTGSIGKVESSAWKQLRQAKASYLELADHFMNVETLNWDANLNLVPTGKPLHDVFEPIKKIKLQKEHKRLAKSKFDLLMGYFKAKRAVELHGQKREHQVDLGDARRMVLLEETYPEFKTIFDDFQAFNNRMLDFYESSGLITKDSRKAIQEMNKSYVPFHRVREYLGTGKVPKGGFHRLVGGTANTEDILINIQDSLAENIRAALVAQGKRTAYKAIATSQDGGIYASPIPTSSEKIKMGEGVIKGKILDAMKQSGIYELLIQVEGNTGQSEKDRLRQFIDENVIIDEGMMSFWRGGMPPSVGDSGNLIDSITDANGETQYWEVNDPLLTEALQAMDPVVTNALVRGAIWVRNFTTTTVTLGLEFMGANIVMDSLGAFTMTTNKDYVPLIHSFIGMLDYLFKTSNYHAFVRGLGGGSKLQAVTRMGSSRRQVKVHEFGHMSIPDHVIIAIRKLASASELGTRVAEFKLSRKGGKSERDAAWDGGQISTNYSVTGAQDMLTQFTRTIPFFNAAIQSIDRMLLEFKSKKGGGNAVNFLIRGALGVMLPTILLYLVNRDDEAYNEQDAHKRFKNWFIPIGKLDNGKTDYFQLPRPYDAGHIFGSLPEIMAEYMIERDGEQATKDFWWVMSNMFSFDPTPAVVSGLGDILTNKKWTGAPVIPEHMQNIDPHEQYDSRTSQAFYELGKSKAGRLLGISPMRWEHMYRSGTGYLGGYLLKAVEVAMWDEKSHGARPAEPDFSHPAIKRFRAPKVSAYTKFTREFFDLKDQAERVSKTLGNAVKPANRLAGRAGVAGFEDDPLLGLSREEKEALKGMDKDFKKLTTELFVNMKMQELTIWYDQTYSADQKRDKIDALWLDRNATLKTAVGEFKQVLREAKAVAAKRKRKERGE